MDLHTASPLSLKDFADWFLKVCFRIVYAASYKDIKATELLKSGLEIVRFLVSRSG